MLSKREKRWSSKKRKIEAFLEVSKLNEREKAVSKRRKTDSSDVLIEPTNLKQSVSTDEGRLSDDTNESTDKQKGSAELPKSELAVLRKELRARQKAAMEKPKLYLTDHLYKGGCQTSASIIFSLDIQHLLSYAIQGNISSYKPRWCRLLRWAKISEIVLVVVNNAGEGHLNQYLDAAPFINEKFEMRIKIATPYQYDCTVEKELFRIPLSKRKNEGKGANANRNKKMYKNVVPIEPVIFDQADTVCDVEGVISPTDIMLNQTQMIQENYPLPVEGQYSHYQFTKNEYKQVSRRSPVFGLDCEMCLTSIGKHELTRVAIVNSKLEVVYDTLCKPYNPIIDYLTKYSGITKTMLDPVKIRLEDVQKVIQSVLPPDAILVGQSLNGDLHALQMFHPYVIDTSVIYNLSGARWKKPGLRRLAAEFLDRDIQNDPAGHNPFEDACVALELAILKIKKGLLFGDVILGGYQPVKEWTQTERAELETKAHVDSSQTFEPAVADKRAEEDTEINRTILMEKRRIFFERQDDSYESFFDIVKQNKKSAVLIGTESNLAEVSDNVEKVKVGSDKEAVRAMKNLENEHFFKCLYLNKFTGCEFEYEDSVKDSLSKVNKRIQKVLKNVQANALCIVLFTGRMGGKRAENGYCLVNVT